MMDKRVVLIRFGILAESINSCLSLRIRVLDVTAG